MWTYVPQAVPHTCWQPLSPDLPSKHGIVSRLKICIQFAYIAFDYQDFKKIGRYYSAFTNIPKLGVMSSVSLWHFIHAWNYCVARGNDNNNHYCSCCISRYKGEYHRKMERSLKSTSLLDHIFTFKVAACFSFATNNKKKVIYSKPIWYQWIQYGVQFVFKYMFKSNQFCEIYCLLQGVL